MTTSIGVVVGQTAWYPTFFTKQHIDFLAQKTRHIRVMVNKFLWETKSTFNPLNLAYPDYIAQLATWIKAAGMTLQIDLSREANDDAGWETADATIIGTPANAQAWVNWGKEVVSRTMPHALTIYNEPLNPMWPDMPASLNYQRTVYVPNLVTPSVAAYRAIKPDLTLVIPACPFFRPSWAIEFLTSIPNSVTSFHLYYDRADTSYFGSKYHNATDAAGLAAAKTAFYAYMDGQIAGRQWYQFHDPTGLTWEKCWFDEFGVFDNHDWPAHGVPSNANWQQFLIDLYDYLREKAPLGAQYQIGNKYYEILDPATSYLSYTPYGQAWAQYGANLTPAPTPTSPVVKVVAGFGIVILALAGAYWWLKKKR